MAKYRKASEKTISRGKGKSTDQLSLADAKEYFNSRAKETGAKRFRWNGEVYDLSGNKVSEAPARSSGGGSRNSLSRREEPKRPQANPRRGRGDGGAETVRRAGDRALSRLDGGTKAPASRSEANPAVVGAMAAGAAAAGIAAARSGRGGRTTGGGSAQTSRNALPKPETRLALPAPNRGGTIIPEVQKPKALPKPEPKPAPQAKPAKPRAKPKAKPAAKPRGGARAGGPGGGFGQPNVFEKALNPLNLYKGGMVKKK